MNTNELKLSITQIIDQINDDRVLEAYYEILKNLLKLRGSQEVGFDIDGKPITRKGLTNKVINARNRIEAGQSISHEELKSDFKNW